MQREATPAVRKQEAESNGEEDPSDLALTDDTLETDDKPIAESTVEPGDRVTPPEDTM
jgi:hypothetical protein